MKNCIWEPLDYLKDVSHPKLEIKDKVLHFSGVKENRVYRFLLPQLCSLFPDIKTLYGWNNEVTSKVIEDLDN
jgi:hypothetical protein